MTKITTWSIASSLDVVYVDGENTAQLVVKNEVEPLSTKMVTLDGAQLLELRVTLQEILTKLPTDH